MRIGVPKEIKVHEYRVGLVPASVRELTHHGHAVAVEAGAGQGCGFPDAAYAAAGATIAETARAVFGAADFDFLIFETLQQTHEPRPGADCRLRYQHLAAEPAQTAGLVTSGVTAIAYETVTDAQGGLPLLAPMSEVAGRMAVQVGAHCLEKEQGGAGILLGGVPGVPAARVVVLGGGVVGTNAARMAMGLEASLIVIDKALPRLYALDLQFGARLQTLYSTIDAIERSVVAADLVIGAVLVPGAAAPKLVSRDMVRRMRPGSVVVDVAIDQGGCFETSRPTTHAQPTYVEEGVVHYCVTNMPGAVARTSAGALNNATLPFVMAIADKGLARALLDDPHLMNGLNIHRGQVTHKAVARDLGYTYVPPHRGLEA